MADARLRELTRVAAELRTRGLNPVLVGGMALVVMGSQRVTKDVDFVVTHPGAQLDKVVERLYGRGFELISRVSDAGEVASTIDNPAVACARLRIDKPASLFFFNRKIDLRVDLMLDFPEPAVDLLRNAKAVKIRSERLDVASPEDLLRLKEIARAGRSFAGDAQDIEFLKERLGAARKK
jgi:hypothetical protein